MLQLLNPLEGRWWLPFPQLEANLHQKLWLLLRATPARLFTELRQTASRMLDLFTLLAGEPMIFEAMIAQSQIAHKRRFSEYVDVLFSPVGRDIVQTIEEHRMLLRFRDVELRLPRLFSRWLESFEVLQPAFDLYFSMLRRDPGYQEPRFLGLVTALESLHRRRSKEQPSAEHQERVARVLTPLNSKDRKWLKGRLKYSYEKTLAMRMAELLRPFDDLFGKPEQQRSFVERVTDTRNYLTHYDPALKSRSINPSKLLPYLFRLRVLFILQCLLELGFSAPDARNLVEKHDTLSQMVRFSER